ncbi:metal-dependent hydrolase [Haloimpatiens lingqiaonensis]|uniref:metal-dependent hydrolase n=1 Tax=Haloimpatiens lingqiaonensis TaxID=1380675 RepID=UPI0010FF4DD6|nr:metal-dependent hydrolase [Haloimpatiens lingqiaonensis]
MTGKTHAGIGIVTYIGLCDKLPGKFSYIGIVVVGIASLLPDADHPKGILNKYILPFKNKATKVAVYVGMGLITLLLDHFCFNKPIVKVLGFILIMIGFSSHREGITHSIVGMVLFTLIASYLGKMYGIHQITYYFLIGYGMHLICDMFTKRGVPIFYPFKNKKYKTPVNFSTGSKVGIIVEEIIMMVGLMYVIYRLPFILF